MKELTGSVIVSYSFKGNENDTLIVGKQEKGKVQVLNALQGENARALLDLLLTKEEKKNA